MAADQVVEVVQRKRKSWHHDGTAGSEPTPVLAAGHPSEVIAGLNVNTTSDIAMPLDDSRPIWTRQPEETDREWAWFQLYRGLHPALRSVAQAYREYQAAKGIDPSQVGHVPAWVQTASHKWSWRERAAEYDVHIDLEYNVAVVKARKKAVMDVAELGKNMRKAAALAVQDLFDRLYTVEVDPRTGEKKIVFNEHLSVSDITRLAKTGVELERLALGMDEGKQGPGTSINIGIAVSQQGETVAQDDEQLLEEAAEVLRTRELQARIVEGEFEEG
ncbi:MAG: hypothetical protein GF414_00710 [Candidatus Altiarchaeales archaeon]|nr:hypothetical protein [Candidatus Altiarchaeales archaeon]